MDQPFAVDGQSLRGVTDLRVQHPQRQFRAGGRKAAEMRMRIGFQSAGQGACRASSRCRGIASNSPAAGSARTAARNSLRRPS